MQCPTQAAAPSLLRGAWQSRWVTMAAGCTPEKISVCIAVRRYVPSDHVALRVNPVAFAGRCAGDIDRSEVSCLSQETVEYAVTADVGANNSRRIDDHRRERSRCARDIDHRELASTEKVAVPVEKIVAGKSHAHDIAGVADAEAGSTHRIGAGKINRRNGASAQHVGVSSGIGAIPSHDGPTGVDPGNIGARCSWNVNG